MIEAQQPQGQQPTPYVPTSIEPLLFEEFEGINTATLRPGVDDKQAAWLDGWMPLGPRRNLRTMYGLSVSFFTTVGPTLVFFYFANIGSTPYAILFLSDGSIVSVNTNTKVAAQLAIAGTIQNPSQLNVGLAQYGSKYVLIVAKQTNGYFIWDGTTFFVPGSAFLTGTIPIGTNGTTIEIYTGRVWIASGPTVTFSAPGSLIDFSSGGGGGNFTSTDSFLRVGFTQLKQTNGFLYLIADSSINYISGVQTSGSPPVTTFTNQNADPEVGTPWPNSVDVFNRNILFGNAFGAHVSYGGAVTKISEPLDGVYNTVPNFGNFIPSAAKAIIFGKKCWMLLLPIVDPVTGQQVNKLMLTRDPVGKVWWTSPQDVSLIYIQFQEINSVLTAWGTDGMSLFQLFAQPSVNFTKTAQTKLWDKPGGYQLTKWVSRFWAILQYYSNLSTAVTVAIDNELNSLPGSVTINPIAITWLNNAGNPVQWLNNSNQPIAWILSGVNYTVLSPTAIQGEGVLIGFTAKTNAADMAVVSMMMQPDVAGYRG